MNKGMKTHDFYNTPYFHRVPETMSLNFGEENSIQAGHSLSVSIWSFSMKDALPQGEDVVLFSARVTKSSTRLQQIPFEGWGFRKQ